MLYCDAVIDAMNKGLGKQHICVRINILTSVMDLVGLYFLLPVWGMKGYFLSFVITHAVNMLLSLALLLKSTGLRIAPTVPVYTVAAMMSGLWCAEFLRMGAAKAAVFLLICFGAFYIFGILYPEDLRWLLSLPRVGKKIEKT